jgi:amylosucrase
MAAGPRIRPRPQYLDLADLGNRSQFQLGQLTDLYPGESPARFKDRLVIPPQHFYWLTDQRPVRL